MLCHESAENSDPVWLRQMATNKPERSVVAVSPPPRESIPLRMPGVAEICVQRGGVSSKENSQNNQTAQGAGLGDGKHILNQLAVAESESIAEREERDDANRQQLSG